MPKDVGVWTAADCALVLADYQNEMFEVVLVVAEAESGPHQLMEATEMAGRLAGKVCVITGAARKDEVDLVFYLTRAAWAHLKASRGVVVNMAPLNGSQLQEPPSDSPHDE